MGSVFNDVFAISFEARNVAQVLNSVNQQAQAVNRLQAAYARVNTAQASGSASQIRNAQNSLNSLTAQTQRANALASVTGATIAGAGALGLLREEISLVKDAVEVYSKYAAQVQTVNQLTGAGLGASQSFVNLSKVAGVSDTGQIKEVLALAKDLQSAKGSNALAQLGVTAGGNELETFQKVVAALGKMQDGVKKTNLELELFKGRSVASLQPYLNLQDDIIQKTALFSANLDGDAIASITHLQQNLGVLGLAFTNDIVIPIAKQVVPVLDSLVSGAEKVIEAFHNFDEGTHGLGSFLVILTGIGAGFGLAVIAAGKFIAVIKDLIAVEEIRNVVAAAYDALTGNWKAIAAAAVVGGVAYAGYSYLNKQNNIGGTSDAANTTSNAADRFSDHVDRFGAAVNTLQSWSQAGGDQVPQGISATSFAWLQEQRVQGAVG